MKQTNNAIKFLMAQYRAIFKNAYFKGLAAAALVTTGLAVGAAQAETVYLPDSDGHTITDSHSSKDIIVTGTVLIANQSTDNSSKASSILVQDGTLKNAHDTGNYLAVKNSLKLDNGIINLKNSVIEGREKFASGDGFTASLSTTGNNKINLQNSQVQMGSITLTEGTDVYIGGSISYGTPKNNGWNTASSMLAAQADSGDTSASTMLINGANITIDDDGLLTINKNTKDKAADSIFTMNAGTINLTGSALARRGTGDDGDSGDYYDITKDKDAEGNDIGAAIVSTNSAVANFNGGQIIVAEGDVGQIHGANMSFKGTTFENAGTMQIGGRLTVKTSTTDKGAITMTAGAINNSGILHLGSALGNDGETFVNDKSTINAKGGTITNSSDGEIHVHSTLKMTGADIDNEGNLIVEDGAVFELDEQKDNKTVDGVLTVGGNVQVDGRINVVNGTLDLSSASSITSQGDATTLGSAQNTILVGDVVNKKDTGATLKMTEQQVHDFLNTQGFVSAEQRDTAGNIALGNYGTLDFGDSVTLSNFNFLISNNADLNNPLGGALVVYGDTNDSKNQGANFKATTMTLEDALLRADDNTVTDLPATTLHADNLNLHYDGVESVKDFDGNFSFTDAVVGKNLDVTYKGGDNKLKLANDIELSAYTPATTVNNQTTHAVAQDGTITGNDFVLVNDGSNHSGSISVKHGNWTATQNITLTSGSSISVGLDLDEDNSNAVYANTTDSSLALNGGLTFDLASGNSSVKASGLSHFNPLLDDREANDYSAQLDLTGGLAVINGSNGKSGSITAESGGVVTLNASDVNDILSSDSGSNSLAHLGLVAKSHGAIQAVNGNVSADFTDFKSGDSAANGEINLSGGAFITENLTLAGDSTNEADVTLDIGTGSIYTDSLTLTDLKNDTSTSYEGSTQVTLASGEINVGNSLSTNAANLIVGAGADVYLGSDNLVEGTLVANKLTINGSTNFENGSWNASSVDFVVTGANSALTVGNTYHEAGASLQGNKLTVGDAGEVRVYGNGEASFNTIDVADAGVAAVHVNGKMTINGQAGDMDTDRTVEDHHGVYFGDTSRGADGVFYVDGSNALLEFGTEASKAFYNSANQTADNGVVADESGNYSTVYVESYAEKSLTVNEGGTVKLNLGDQTFSKAQIADLKNKLFTRSKDNSSTLLDGFLDIGDSQISGINVVDGAIAWSELADITDIVWDVTNTELGTARVTGVDGSSQIGGTYGSLEVTDQTSQVQIVSNTTLGNAAGNQNNFIGHTNGQVAGALVHTGKVLTLNGAGNVGSLSLQNGTSDDETIVWLNASESGDAINVSGSITGNLDGHNSVVVNGAGTVTVEQAIRADSVGVGYGVAGNLVAKGDVNVTDFWADYGATITAEKSVSANGSLEADRASTIAVAGDLTVGTTSHMGFMSIEDGSKVTVAKNFTAHGGLLRIGSSEISNTEYLEAELADGTNPYDDYVQDANEDTDNATPLLQNEASSGFFEVAGETRLNGATVFADPDYGMDSTIVAFNTFSGSNTNQGLLGTLDGNIVVGKNAAVGLGISAAQLAERIAQYQTNGSLSENGYGSILYINGQINVADGQYIALSSNSSNKTVAQVMDDFGTNTADMYLGDNTALIISDNAVQAAGNARESSHDAAIEFNKSNAAVYAQADAAVLLDGTTFSLNDIKLFDDADGNGVNLTTADNEALYIGTVSGLFEAWMPVGENSGTIQLSITRDGLENTVLSTPVKNSLYTILGDSVTPDSVPMVDIVPPTTDEQASGDGVTPAADEPTVDQPDNTTGNTTKEHRYVLERGSFLATALAEQASLQSVEQAARLGVYAGVAQATLGATNTTTDAISGRMGVGAQSGTITYADNGQGAGLWLSPVYKNHSSDGFDAEGADYGVDMDLYGLALGADYTLANGVRIGAMFNVGSGDADGNGVASVVSNDFDYYGFGVYGGYTMGALSVVADVTYTAVDNDFDSSTGLTNYSKLEGSADSDALSIGVTGQYEFATQSMTVTPHAGLRFTKVSIDDYTVKAGGTEIADFSADDLNVFSIPVGVTFASEFTSGAWSVQPSLDVTLTANAGDTDLDGDSRWLGTDNGFGEMTYGVSTEVLDDFTYGATLGIAAKTGGFSLGLGVNYTGSSNTDEFGVNANARFVF